MLGLHDGSVVSADSLIELLWSDDPPRTAAKALQTHISALRRTLGDGVVVTLGAGWALAGVDVDASRYKIAARLGRDAAAAGDISQAVARFEEALSLWRGTPELPDGQRGESEKTRWIETNSALVEDRADALLASGRAAEIIGELEAAVAEAPLRERRWGQLMLALYRAGRQGEALGAYQRARSLLAKQLGVDPGPELRRLEAAIVAQDSALDMPVAQQASSITRAVTFLLTDIEGSTAAWEADAEAMAVALARHDELVEQVVTSRGGRLVKTRGEGDATFSVFERPSAAAAAAIELQDAMDHEPWELQTPLRIRVALHTGEVELRDGDYFGRAVNRAARLRSLASGGQILCSGATAELVIDSLPDDVVLADLGMRQLRNLTRPEHVFELRLHTDDDPQDVSIDEPVSRPELPAVLTNTGPFVGRGRELARLLGAWQAALGGGMSAVLIAGEPGVGKTRLAAEWSLQAYEQGAFVLYGRCDEDLGAPYQPFAEALRSLVPCLGEGRLRGLRGLESLLALVPGLTDILPDLSAPTRADPDTERYALFDAVVAVLELASASAPIVLIIDDLHWAAKPTLLLLRHLLRFGERARVQVIGTYRSTDLDRSHPLAAMLADLHRDGTAERLALSGLDEDDVTAYVAEAGYDDEDLARALASVTGGNPFFLIEALRHVDESGGVWDQSTLPQGVREAVSRRLSRLPAETNKALAAAAVVGSRFDVELVERVVDQDLVDAFDEACKAGIVIEEPGGRYRFNHALVRQSLLAELPSVRRMRLHQRIAATLENQPGADDELLADLAHHYFECAWAGNAAKAVEYCRRAADQAMARLAYEGAADLYDHALHALEELDDELPDRDDQIAELLVARCEALLAAGDMTSATDAVAQLQSATSDSPRLAAWAACFDGQLSMLTHPERLDAIESAVSAAAEQLAALEDAAGEAKAHTVRAGCLARLGRIGDAEIALDHALTAARRAREHRRVNAVLANAPLAALWGPNPVPRAGGRCLDVVRLLRITTDSPAVEATSTRCQAVLEAFRGRAAAARRMIDSARRTVTELGLRHALLEVEQFAGIVELVVGDPAAAEPHLRKAYTGFRRLGLDADTAETAALLGRACLALDRADEAEKLCAESERLAGHALKPSIAWRTLRAHLLSCRGEHDEARHLAEAAVGLAERTDLLVDHGDACLALAVVLRAAGADSGARAAAERAAELYEQKDAAALAEKAHAVLGQPVAAAPEAVPEGTQAEPWNECVRVIRCAQDALDREAWNELAELFGTDAAIESRRKIVHFTQQDITAANFPLITRLLHEADGMRVHITVVAVRGEHLALTRMWLVTADASPDAPRDELLHLFGIDTDGRITLQISFDTDDLAAAMAELDAQHARFEQSIQQPRPLENAASRVLGDYLSHFATRDWDAMAAALADDFAADDRRRVINAGIRRGRDNEITNVRAIAQLGCEEITSTPIATRGEHLVLARHLFAHPEWHDPFRNEVIDVVEIDTDNRIIAEVAFDADDLTSAFAELDARYVAGEAAPYAHVWQDAVTSLAEVNRHERGRMVDSIDYSDRRRVPFAPGDFQRAAEQLWTMVPDARYRVTAVHALDERATVASLLIEGTDTQGNTLQWPRCVLYTAAPQRMEVYEADDVDTALARFEELRRPQRRLENAASRTYQRVNDYFAARDWPAMAEALIPDICDDDRRRGANHGVQYGRDFVLANSQTAATLGATHIAVDVLATRGDRLALCRVCHFGDSQRPAEFHMESLGVVEVNTDGRVVTHVAFSVADLDAALEELDARYLAGEAAPHARVWSAVIDGHAAFNRHEFPDAIPDLVDHRPLVAVGPGDPAAKIRQMWDFTPDLKLYVEAVHRLNERGAVLTQASHGTSQSGFEAEWRVVELVTVDDASVTRAELFDEADLDSAVSRFEELNNSVPRLRNTATKVVERFWSCFAAIDVTATSALLADDVFNADHRPMVNSGVRRGREAILKDIYVSARFGTRITPFIIATRGDRLALIQTRYTGKDQGPRAFAIETLNVFEVDTDEKITALLTYEVDDLDAAFDDLEARYLAGEAAPHARTWSVIAKACAGLIESVHRLNDAGAVFTRFEAERRALDITMVDGDAVSGIELFDEAELDAALAKFDELCRQSSLENRASRVAERLYACFAARDWDGLGDTLAEDICLDDRRKVIGSGIRRGRELNVADLRVVADLGARSISQVVLATRGERLVLGRVHFVINGQDIYENFHTHALRVFEIDDDNRIAAVAMFDPDDVDAALTELDARFLAGEAAPYARTWEVITDTYAAVSRRELPLTTKDFTNVDHRRVTAHAPGDLVGYVRAAWALEDALETYIEMVHRLSHVGAVVTWRAEGTSRDGFDAEWRGVGILTVSGEKVSRCEIFDEVDLDKAIARFDELSRPAQLDNAATRIFERLADAYNRRDLKSFVSLATPSSITHDRRYGLNTVETGLAGRQNLQAIFEVSPYSLRLQYRPIATRGSRLSLVDVHWVDSDDPKRPITIEVLTVMEVSDNGLMQTTVSFDPADLDAAFAELDARYLAGEAAAHSTMWSLIARFYAAHNRGDISGASDWTTIDHRVRETFQAADLTAYIRSAWQLTPDVKMRVESVHRLSNTAALFTHVAYGTTADCFEAEWRMIVLVAVGVDAQNHCELFEEADLEAAVAAFDGLTLR
nr:BTAD domain-containing putative transcriptional regulator [Mycobacterium sp. 1274761.0]